MQAGQEQARPAPVDPTGWPYGRAADHAGSAPGPQRLRPRGPRWARRRRSDCSPAWGGEEEGVGGGS